MKIELTKTSIQTSPEWTPERAICELVANAIDAHLQSHLPISKIDLTYVKNKDIFTFTIIDKATGIDIDNLTIAGKSSKRDTNLPVHGIHGKGLKESIAVLVRNSYQVEIQSPNVSLKAFDNNGDLGYRSYSANPNTSGTRIAITLRNDFRRILKYVESSFTCFKTVGTILEETKHGRVFLPPEGEKGSIYFRGYKINVGRGFCQTPRLSYDIDSEELSKLNLESGNTRKIESNGVLLEIVKIHKSIKSAKIIEIANLAFIEKEKNEFNSKKIVNAYKDKKGEKVNPPRREDDRLVIQETDVTDDLIVLIDTSPLLQNITFYDLDKQKIQLLRSFAKENGILCD